VCLRVCVCACVCERERQREICRERERCLSVFLGVFVRERKRHHDDDLDDHRVVSL